MPKQNQDQSSSSSSPSATPRKRGRPSKKAAAAPVEPVADAEVPAETVDNPPKASTRIVRNEW